MYKVKVENPCSCFIKSGMAEVLEFDTEKEAEQEANKMLANMQSNFCQKHDFTLNKMFGDFTIFIRPRS